MSEPSERDREMAWTAFRNAQFSEGGVQISAFDEAAKAIAAAREEGRREAMAWRPIETAPKKRGTKVLIWDGVFVTVCHWGVQKTWVVSWNGERLLDLHDRRSLQWLPLPEPPP